MGVLRVVVEVVVRVVDVGWVAWLEADVPPCDGVVVEVGEVGQVTDEVVEETTVTGVVDVGVASLSGGSMMHGVVGDSVTIVMDTVSGHGVVKKVMGVVLVIGMVEKLKRGLALRNI